jgi:2-dehydro-3-deoxyphosphogluconate aldolase/(4S)-4-hydroxy-2-oxoglutarate aldolase
MDVLSHILEHKIVAILRGASPDDVLKIAVALHKGGIKILEVTLNSFNALDSIEQLSETMGDKMEIGAGTVLDVETAKSAIDAGAKFIISPSTDPAVIKITKQRGAVSIPGAYTPTEIVNAFHFGGDIIKLFPSSSNVNYIKEIRAPLPHIPLMPTGGINKGNMLDYLNAGASAVGIGSALVNRSHKISEEYLETLTENARQFVQINIDFLKSKNE